MHYQDTVYRFLYAPINGDRIILQVLYSSEGKISEPFLMNNKFSDIVRARTLL